MVKRTFKQLREADLVVGDLFIENKELPKGKFGYAWKRFVDSSYAKIIREYQQKISDIRIDNALEDKITKEILRDKENSRGYKYTKASEKKVIAQENELRDEWDSKEFDVESYYCLPENLPSLNDYQREKLLGIIIKEDEYLDS